MSFDPALEHEGLSPSAGPSGKPNVHNNMNLDSHLSSMRSSAPELQFGEDTLASAADSPSQHHHDTASILHQAAAAAASASASGSPSMSGHAMNPHLEGLKDGEKAQPFSRSPELRVSHKLAERKRRKEMRDMFEELRVMLPAERGSKWSKWEILSKGIDYLEGLKKQNTELLQENDRLRKKVEDVMNFQPGNNSSNTGNTNGNNDSGANYGTFGNYAMMGTGDAAGLGASIDPTLDAGAEERLLGAVGQSEGEKKNTPPLDTDAIRESLTQVGERVESME